MQQAQSTTAAPAAAAAAQSAPRPIETRANPSSSFRWACFVWQRDGRFSMAGWFRRRGDALAYGKRTGLRYLVGDLMGPRP